MSICHENQIAVFADEIQTFARTHALFAFQHFDLLANRHHQHWEIITSMRLALFSMIIAQNRAS